MYGSGECDRDIDPTPFVRPSPWRPPAIPRRRIGNYARTGTFL